MVIDHDEAKVLQFAASSPGFCHLRKMCHEISTKYQMTCVTSMDIVTPKTRLSKAHTGYGTHFLPLASQVLRGPGSLPQVALFPSYGVLSTVHTLHAHSRFACVSSAPKGPLVSLTTVQVPSTLQGSGHKWSLWAPVRGHLFQDRREKKGRGGEVPADWG